MKTPITLFIALAIAALSGGTDLTLKDGRVFRNARIGENADSERVVILHDGGIATVPIASIPDGMTFKKPVPHRSVGQEETEEGCEVKYEYFQKLICVNYRKVRGWPDTYWVKGALQAEYHQIEKSTGYFIAIYLDRAPEEDALGLREAYDWLGNRYEVKDVTVNGKPGDWRRESGYISVPSSLLEQAKASGGSVKFCGRNRSVVLAIEQKAAAGFLLRCSREFAAGE